jgi:hypothetical protein
MTRMPLRGPDPRRDQLTRQPAAERLDLRKALGQFGQKTGHEGRSLS